MPENLVQKWRDAVTTAEQSRVPMVSLPFVTIMVGDSAAPDGKLLMEFFSPGVPNPERHLVVLTDKNVEALVLALSRLYGWL